MLPQLSLMPLSATNAPVLRLPSIHTEQLALGNPPIWKNTSVPEPAPLMVKLNELVKNAFAGCSVSDTQAPKPSQVLGLAAT